MLLMFSGRARTDGKYYAIDFDLAEIKRLKVIERIDVEKNTVIYPTRFPSHQSAFQIPTLSEEIELIQVETSTGKSVGLCVEIKDPEWHQQHGKDVVK